MVDNQKLGDRPHFFNCIFFQASVNWHYAKTSENSNSQHPPLHIIQRGNNKQACFFADDDYLFYLQWFEEYALTSGCLIHTYVLMTNHAHLLLSPPKSSSNAGDLLKRLEQRYVQYINRTYRRTEILWEGRYRSCLIQEGKYLLTCQRHIELNPVRACIVGHSVNLDGQISVFLIGAQRRSAPRFGK